MWSNKWHTGEVESVKRQKQSVHHLMGFLVYFLALHHARFNVTRMNFCWCKEQQCMRKARIKDGQVPSLCPMSIYIYINSAVNNVCGHRHWIRTHWTWWIIKEESWFTSYNIGIALPLYKIISPQIGQFMDEGECSSFVIAMQMHSDQK